MVIVKIGNDVSKWQGKIDWEKAKADGCEFAILRAGYGALITQKDSTFEYNYSECIRLGIPVGAYWYSYWNGTPEQEMEVFLECCEGKTFECGLWDDVEYEPNILALSNAERTDYTIRALEVLEDAGWFAGLYASTDMINNRMEYERLAPYAIWCAQYNSICTCKVNYGMWQHTATGSLDGVDGNVDCNRMYIDYPSVIKAAGLACGNGGDGSTGDSVSADPEEPRVTSTLQIGPMTRGDIVAVLEKAAELGLYVIGTLEVGPMTEGDTAAIATLAEELGLGVTSI